MAAPILIARHGDTECHLLPELANRHGLITGATGTGKTITLQNLAENFSKLGVPVFMADIKGDLTGISQAGSVSPKLAGILKERGIDAPAPLACPTALWDVFGAQGHPVRATVSDMGPLLLSRMLNLNDTQQGVLQLVFKIADDNGLLLLDLKDLRAMLQHGLLHVAQVQQAAEQGRAHLAHRGTHRVAALAEDIPEHHGVGLGAPFRHAGGGGAFQELGLGFTCAGNTREITLHVRGEHRHAQAAEALGEHLQGDGLAGAGRTRHQAVAVGVLGQQQGSGFAAADQEVVGHGGARG